MLSKNTMSLLAVSHIVHVILFAWPTGIVSVVFFITLIAREDASDNFQYFSYMSEPSKTVAKARFCTGLNVVFFMIIKRNFLLEVRFITRKFASSSKISTVIQHLFFF